MTDPSAPTHPGSSGSGTDADGLVEPAVAQVQDWLRLATEHETEVDRRTAGRLHGVVVDPDGVAFAMRFVDRVVRPEDPDVAAHQLRSLVAGQRLAAFLGPVDRALLRAGARMAPWMPRVVMPLARRRMRGIVGHLVVDAERARLAEHLRRGRADGFRLNVNLLGEAVLGQVEADRRHDEIVSFLDQPDVDYVSVKVSAVVSQINHWDPATLDRIVDRLRPLFAKAAVTDPPTFVNLDMEEYHDLDWTSDAFIRVLDEPDLHHVDAGIVLQAYLPDALPALQRLVEWARERHDRVVDGRPGGRIKIRLVKGANLALERVDAEMHGWPQAPYETKAQTDANYKRCLDWVLTPDRTRAVRIGVASHNLFDLAWAHLLTRERDVADRVEFEMLQGMAAPLSRAVRDEAGTVLLYTPAVRETDFDVAISYLFRRLEETAADHNFIRHLFDLEPGTPAFDEQADRFRVAVRDRWEVPVGPRRTQDRREPPEPWPPDRPFANEPDTDPSLPANRAWARQIVRRPAEGARAGIARDVATVDTAVAASAGAQPDWWARGAGARRQVLRAVADELARRRGDLVHAMVHEGRKTVAQADPEVSEAIDFARWYADRALDVTRDDNVRFDPFGVVAVVPPWNFPVAIPAGGTLASLAAGNGVILKPAPETPRCAEIVAECCWSGGVPADLLQYLRTPDDDVGRHLVSHPDVDAVILTGAYETAQMFRSWRADRPVLAETSGKNALVITPHADLDLAVDDLVASAFGHSGQKCSAASLAICVGDVYASDRFRRQLVDAVRSLEVGPTTRLGTTMGPLIGPPTDKLRRGLTRLDPGESWVVEPRHVEGDLWTPGVRDGVAPGSWFHQTECFGPVLGLMHAQDLDHAIELQNGTPFGLTGGIHTLDPTEADHWVDHVAVGNAYVNRGITGAIVRRQPFGGWRRSSVGPGAKAGGPNYVAQLGTWSDTSELHDEAWLQRARSSDEAAWREAFGICHDPAGLTVEANVFRYRPVERMIAVATDDVPEVERLRVEAAGRRCGVSVEWWDAAELAGQIATLRVERVRVLGAVPVALSDAARAAGVHLVDAPVTADGWCELRHYVREQAVSRTLHRYGNLVA